MKKITLFLLTLLLFVSCNNDNHFSGYYEEDYEEDYIDTIKVEKPKRIIYYCEYVNGDPKLCKDTMVTINCYNDGFSINDIRYKATKVTAERDLGCLVLVNVTSEETEEYYSRVLMQTWDGSSFRFIIFYGEEYPMRTKAFYDEMHRWY